MKKLLFLLLFIPLAFACSDDDSTSLTVTNLDSTKPIFKSLYQYPLNTHKMKNNKMKNIITIVLLIMLVVGAGLMMWEARNGFPPS